MPVYDFHCTKCGCEFEKELGVNDDRGKLKCPDCKSKKIERSFGNISFGVKGGKHSDSCASPSCGTCSTHTCNH